MENTLASNLFFIIGTGRCGTTLLRSMLCAHPHIYVPPETHFFQRWDPQLPQYGGDPISPDRLNAYLDDWFSSQNWVDQGLDREEVEASIRAGDGSARSIFLAIVKACGRQAGKWRIGEKTPIHGRYVKRIRALFPAAKFIHIFRDPRDVTASLMRMPWAHGTVRDFARRWVKFINEQSEVKRRLGPDHYLTVQYEALVGSPSTHLRRICDFLDEPFDPAMLAHEHSARAGFPVRFPDWQRATTEAVNSKSIGRFRQDLSPRQIACVERVVGSHMDRFGYQRLYAWRQYHPQWMACDFCAHLFGKMRRWSYRTS